MTAITTTRPLALPVPRWVWLAVALAVGVLWLVTFEGGSLSRALSGSASFLHEAFHDGRHLLGVPCH
jgi:hypothetical protein